MATEKEYFEVLLEDIGDRVKTIAAGHQALRSEMPEGFTTLTDEMKELTSEFHLYAEVTSVTSPRRKSILKEDEIK